ncbi:MAG: GNAT family N-acetyltransferase [Chloroflexota bacterium]
MIASATPADGDGIINVTSSIEVFSPEENECVAELWNEFILKGSRESGYSFLVARESGRVTGFACYGPRALTSGTFDLYWIAVDPRARRKGLGRELLASVEAGVINDGGRLVIVETSGQEKYDQTRAFYIAAGYTLEATVKDFYQQEDDLVIFTKHV